MADTPSPQRAEFDAFSLALADSRLALLVLNHGRHLVLRRMFGVSRAEANLLTAVLALGGLDLAYGTARRIIHTPIPLTGRDALAGGFVMREGALGIAGPGARAFPFAGALLSAAVVGGFVVPGMRRALASARATEHRLRKARERQYDAARGAMASLRDTVAASVRADEPAEAPADA
jgi:hypothetical protein